MRRLGRAGVVVLLAASSSGAAAVLGGCVVEGRTRPLPTPQAPRPSSAEVFRASRVDGAAVQNVLMSLASPEDADGDGLPDTVPVVVYLFGDTSRRASPVTADGAFLFEMRSLEGADLGTWLFDAARSRDAVVRLAPGPAFAFGLRMPPRTEGLPQTAASVSARFLPSDGSAAVPASQAATVRIGRPTGLP